MDGMFNLLLALVAILFAVWVYMNYMRKVEDSQPETGGVSSTTERLINVVADPKNLRDKPEQSVDMIDWRHDDPKYSKYSRRIPDGMGMNGSDYYYENDALYRQGVIGEQLGRGLFESQFDMPDTRGDPDHNFYPSSRWSGSVESAEPMVGGSEDLEQFQSLTDLSQADVLFSRHSGSETPHSDLTDMSQADVVFG